MWAFTLPTFEKEVDFLWIICNNNFGKYHYIKRETLKNQFNCHDWWIHLVNKYCYCRILGTVVIVCLVTRNFSYWLNSSILGLILGVLNQFKGSMTELKMKWMEEHCNKKYLLFKHTWKEPINNRLSWRHQWEIPEHMKKWQKGQNPPSFLIYQYVYIEIKLYPKFENKNSSLIVVPSDSALFRTLL